MNTENYNNEKLLFTSLEVFMASQSMTSLINKKLDFIPLINREQGHYREISDRGLDLLPERWRGQYIKVEV